jgi:hypothetical protein
MWQREASIIVLSLACTLPARAQELHANVGYAHIFRAGGFSFATGYLQQLGAATAAVRQRVGGDFWYANTDVASQPAGNAGRNVVGLGGRYEVEMTRCCGRVHPVAAVPVQLIHSSVPEPAVLFVSERPAIQLVPTPIEGPPAEDRGGSAWGWGAGLELGVRVAVSPQWNLQTSGTAMYQDVYAASTTNGAWTWHVGLSYRFGS